MYVRSGPVGESGAELIQLVHQIRKLLPGENRIEARCGELRDSVALRVGTALKARDFEALRKTKGLRSKD